MSDRPDDKKKQDNREERLRAALRANLQRRKAQARDLSGPEPKNDANGD